MPFTVTVCHDEAAGVWYVHDSDLPGLHAEAATLDALVAIIADVTPDLAVNLPETDTGHPEIPVRIQHLLVARRAA